jgi:1,4-alpha-glucan branching enzyme
MSTSIKKDVGVIVKHTGVSFRVWAPFADNVALIGTFNDWTEQPMESEHDGYWSLFARGAEPGQEYKYVIKNGLNIHQRNDPRALHYTTAPGNSVIVSPYFDWQNDNFVAPPQNEQIIYELHVGTFNRLDPSICGTFDEVIDKLDYLKNLGINMIELMPISTMLMDRGWGYAIDYIYAVETLYGGRYNFLKFVREAHSRGIGVILDVVYNHFGPDESLDLWQFDGWSQNDLGGIYFYNDERAITPWGNTRPDFGRPEVRQYILDNIQMWVHETRIDGLRVDSTIYIRNTKGFNDDQTHDLPEGWLLLQQINQIAKKINPNIITIAEDVAGNDFISKPSEEGGANFSSQWELGFPHALEEALKYEDASKINLTGICSQITKKFNNNATERVIFSDSHDSAANGSSRLNEVLSPKHSADYFARHQALLAAALLFTSPGIPMLFQGQEFMEEGSFNDWKGLDWSKQEKYPEIVKAYTDLISLRKNSLGLTAGLKGQNVNLSQVDEDNKVLSYHRWERGGVRDDVVIVINFSNKEFNDYQVNFPKNGLWHVRFNSNLADYSPDFKDIPVGDVHVENGSGVTKLPPSTCLIFSQDM